MEVRLELDAAALYTAFSKAPERVRSHLRIALKVSAEEVKEHAQAHHAFKTRTGGVERSIATGFVEPMSATVSVGSQVGAFIHSGTRPHDIVPKNRSALRWATPGSAKGFAFARKVHHPGTSPDPFLHAALAAKEGAIVTRMQGAVSAAIKEVGL